MIPHSFLIFMIWIFPFFFLVNILKDLSILLIFLKNKILVLLILSTVSSFSNLFISILIIIISFLLLALGLAFMLVPQVVNLGCWFEIFFLI